MSGELDGMSNRDLAKGLVALTFAQKQIGKALVRLRKLANTRLVAKEVVAAVDVHGNTIGSITRTNPSKEWVIEDLPVLLAHLQDNTPDALYDADVRKPGLSEEQILGALKAAGLTDTEVRIRDYELNYLLQKSASDKAPAAPGIGCIQPSGTTNVYPSDKDHVAELNAVLTSGEVSLLTGEVTKLIEGTDGDQNS